MLRQISFSLVFHITYIKITHTRDNMSACLQQTATGQILIKNYVEIVPLEDPKLELFQLADRRVSVVRTSACYSGKSEDQTSIRKPTILRYFAVSPVPPGRYVKSGHDGFILLCFPVPYSLLIRLTIRCAIQSALLKTTRNGQTMNE